MKKLVIKNENNQVMVVVNKIDGGYEAKCVSYIAPLYLEITKENKEKIKIKLETQK